MSDGNVTASSGMRSDAAKSSANRTVFWAGLVILALLIIGSLAYLAGQSNNQPTTDNNQQNAPQSNPANNPTQRVDNDSDGEDNITIYFSKSPESDDDPTVVFPVERQPEGENKIVSAIEAYIAGPTNAEAAAGYYSEFELSGTSNCRGSFFTYTVDNENITVKFCRTVVGLGTMADGRVLQTLKKTLSEVSDREAIILDQNGDCLFDMSGMNLCLQ